MDEKKKVQLAIIGAFVVLALIIVGIIALFFKVNGGTEGQYAATEEVDPTSGETVIRTDGKTPEAYGQNPNTPLMLGLVGFLDRGISMEELQRIKAAFTDYANQRITKNQEKIEQISVDGDSITHTIEAKTGNGLFTANVVINNKTNAIMDIKSDGISKMIIKIYLGDEIAGAPDFSTTKSL